MRANRASHVFRDAAAKTESTGAGGGVARKRLTRIGTEVSSLATSLPVEAGSGIFVRVDDERIDVMKALILGPEGTPYVGGVHDHQPYHSSPPPPPPQVWSEHHAQRAGSDVR